MAPRREILQDWGSHLQLGAEVVGLPDRDRPARPFPVPATKPGPKAGGPLAIRDIPVDDKELQKCAAGRKNQGSR